MALYCELSELIQCGNLCQYCGGDVKGKPPGFPIACKKCLGTNWDDRVPGVYCETFSSYHKRFAERVDYWPTTQKFYDRISGEKGQGGKNFDAHLKTTLIRRAHAHREMAASSRKHGA